MNWQEFWQSFSFGHPAWLALLIVPLVLAAWEVVRRGPRVALPLDHSDKQSNRWLGRLVVAAQLLPALLLAIAILLLCRPLVASVPKEHRRLTNIEFVLDVSGSMEAQFGEGTRYDAAMKAIEDFTTDRQGDAFGLTIFGNEVLRWTPLTQDLSAIRSATPFLRPNDLPSQFNGTSIGKGVLYCGETLAARGEGDRLMVLISDGESSDLGQQRSREIGQQLAAEEIVLYVVHIGDFEPPADMYDLAHPTRGQVFSAGNPAALASIFSHIDRMQPV